MSFEVQAVFLSERGVLVKMVRSSTRSSGPGRSEIVVYPHRRRMMAWLLVGMLSAFVLLLFLLVLLVLMILVPSISHDGAAIVLALFLSSMVTLGIWANWTLAQFFFSGEPTLIINREGISIGKIYGAFEIQLSWEEIEGIYLIGDHFLHTQLSFRLINSSASLSRFRWYQRILLRLNGAPIAILQSYLDIPIEEILHHIQRRYGRQLAHYHIQLHRQHNASWW